MGRRTPGFEGPRGQASGTGAWAGIGLPCATSCGAGQEKQQAAGRLPGARGVLPGCFLGVLSRGALSGCFIGVFYLGGGCTGGGGWHKGHFLCESTSPTACRRCSCWLLLRHESKAATVCTVDNAFAVGHNSSAGEWRTRSCPVCSQLTLVCRHVLQQRKNLPLLAATGCNPPHRRAQ